MRFQEFLDMLPPRDDVLRLARYFQQTREPDYSGLVACTAAGLVVGAAVALLFAPNSGSELRRAIGERAEGLREKAQEFGSRVKSNSNGVTPHASI
jgi:hypothetical protein